MRDGIAPVEEVLRGMDDPVRAGKVPYVGMSDIPGVAGVADAGHRGVARLGAAIALEIPCNLIERTVGAT